VERRGGRVLTTTTRVPALDDAAVAEVIRAAAARQSVIVAHGLSPDAAGDDAALHELATSLPTSWWCSCVGDVEPETTLCAAEVAPTLPSDGDESVVTRLYHLQRMPAVGDLISSVYDQIERAWPASEPWLARDAGLFLSSPGAVTSAHADRHHNLLVQLEGSKEIGVALPGSQAHAEIVASSVPSLRCPQMPPGAKTYQLEPGTAMYLPPYSVHWVRSTERSVALSLAWSSAATVRAGEVHAANAVFQRRLKVPARPVGSRGDEAKVRVMAAANRVRSVVRRG
jgi:hypothetical protein